MKKKYTAMKRIALFVLLAIVFSVSVCRAENDKRDFAIDFLRESIEMYGDENLLVSPLSAEMALSLTSNGAKGQTQTEILEMLGVSKGQQLLLNKRYGDMMIELQEKDSMSIVKMTNAVWIDDEFNLSKSFVDSSKYYYACVDAIDLQNPANAKVINKWASDNTDNMINDIVNEDMFKSDLRMIIANALCFKGKWQMPFDEGMSADRSFYKENGEVDKVRMMRKTAHYRYFRPEKSDFQMVCLDYDGRKYEMVVLLPDEGKSVTDVIGELTSKTLAEWSRNARKRNIHLELPSFKMEWNRSLNDCFRRMGMERAFTGRADFTGLSDSERLSISDISQFTYIDVDESGTEAAAVTMISIKCTAAIMPEEVYPFVVNRPFLLFIRDKASEEILFAGKIGNPVR